MTTSDKKFIPWSGTVIEIAVSNQDKINKIIHVRDNLKAAEKIKCKCSGFVIQYEGRCCCEASTKPAELKYLLWRIIEDL